MSVKRAYKITGITAGSIVLAVVLALLGAWLFITPLARSAVQHLLADTPQMSVDFQNLSVSPAKGHIELIRLKVQKDDLRISVDSLHLSAIQWMPLIFSKQLQFDDLYLQKATFSADLYSAAIDSVRHSTRRTDVYGADAHPKNGKNDFANELGYRKNWMQVSVGHFYVTGLDLERLAKGKGCRADSVQMDRLQCYVYADNTVNELTYQPMPMQLLRQMDLPVDIGHLGVRDGKVIYEAKTAGRQQTAKMTVYGIDLDLPDFSNSSRAKGNLTVNASIERHLPVSCQLTYDLADKTDYFTLTAQAGPGDLTVINPYLVPNALLYLRSGSLNRLEMVAAGDSLGMKGYLSIDYNQLKVDYLKEKDGMALQKRHPLISMLANSVIPNNHPSEKLPENLKPSDLKLSGKDRTKGVKHLKGFHTPVTVVERTPYTSLPYLIFCFALKGVAVTLWE